MQTKTSTRYYRIFLPLLILFLVASACRLPQPDSNQPTQEPTQPAESTLPALPSETAAEPTQVPTEAPTATAEPSSAYRGFMAFKDQTMTAYDFNGAALDFQASAGGNEWLGEMGVSITADAVFYPGLDDGRIHKASSAGDQVLDFIQAKNFEPLHFVVSSDGQKIAWTTQSWGQDAPGSEVWTANIDGSNTQKIDEILPENNRDRWLVFLPYRWQPDGKLLYGTQLSGIGGYILYAGFNGMRLYNPADGSIQVLVNDDERLGLCLNSVSTDLSLAAIGCSPNAVGMQVRNLSSGSSITFPVLPEQTVSGSGRFSPSNQWIAYAVARSNPENERSQVVIAPVNGSSAPQALQTMEGGNYSILGWISEDTFLFAQYLMNDNQSTIWKINRDGSGLTQLANGYFLGMLP